MNFSPNAYHLLPANSGGDGISKSLRAEAKWVCWHSQVVTAAQWWEASLSWIIGCAACNTQSPFGSSICRTLFSLSFFFFLLLFAGRLSQAARRISRIYALRMVVESTCPSTRNKVKPIVLAVTTAERFAMKFKVAAICLLLGLSTVLAQDSCEIGTCVVIRQCPQLLKILTTFPRDDAGLDKLRSRNCGYEKRYPRVCCTPEEMIDADQKLNINTNSNNNQNNNNNNQNDNDNNNNQNNNRLIVVTPPSVSSGDYESAKKLLPSDCGRDLSNRIVGGNITGLDEFPWMALLEYRKPTGKATACGGVLISHRYVLTAAHCVKTGALPKSWSLIGVRLGEYNTATDRDCIPDGDEDTICADDPISVGIEEQIVHENYGANSVNQHYDIALLRLSRDVPFTNYIKPICLPIGPNISNKLVVAGWGKTEYRSESEVKLKVSLPLVSNSECSKRYQRQMIESQLCAGGEQGKDSCRGDSGGPIMQQSRRPEDRSLRWEAAGVVSFGPSPCGMQGWPGVYTNVYYYVPWILSKLRP